MFECPNCSGNLKFSIETQDMACAYCDSHFNPYMIQKETDATRTDTFETTVFTCPQCGGEIYSSANEAATFCIYCGSSTILSERISEEKRPKYIITFKKTKEDCKKAFAKKMRYAFFVPKEYKDPQFIDSFRGIYMPYWSYHIEHEGTVSLWGKESFRSGDYIITNHYNLYTNIKAEVDGDSYDASTAFYDDISRSLEPYDFVERMDFTPSLLSGFYGDCADVDSDLYQEDADQFAKDCILDTVKGYERFRKYTIDKNSEQKVRNSMQPIATQVDSTMYPVWFMTYRNGERVAYATVNGQTGKVVADMPVDAKKYLLGSLLLAVPLFFLLNLIVTFNPKEMLCLCAGLLFVSLLLFVSELSAIYKREFFVNDKAMLVKEGRSQEYEKKKTALFEGYVLGLDKVFRFIPLFIWGFVIVITVGIEFASIVKYLIWPIILVGTVICSVGAIKEMRKLENTKGYMSTVISMIVVFVAAGVALLAPVHDYWYYIGAIFTLLAVAGNFMEIIRNYNLLAMRKLPQFNKRGGDDYA